MLRCEIQVSTPPERSFRPMQQVSGIIKYTAYEEIMLKKIVISLKGIGLLDVKGKVRRKFRETYIDIHKIVQENQRGFTLRAGTYVERFSFELPSNIPGSIETRQETARHIVKNCYVQYYVRIKFDRGYWKADKTFKKNIVVRPLLIPRLPQEPVKYETFKHINGFIYSGIIRLVAAIECSVIYGRETIVVHYKLQNNTNTRLEKVCTSLVEVYCFKPNRPLINAKTYTDIENTTTTFNHIGHGTSVAETVEIEVPPHLSSLELSTLITRQYYVIITVQIPKPYSDIVLKIPVQIGDENSRIDANEDDIGTSNTYFGPPPSYWEIMGEMVPVESEEDAT